MEKKVRCGSQSITKSGEEVDEYLNTTWLKGDQPMNPAGTSRQKNLFEEGFDGTQIIFTSYMTCSLISGIQDLKKK